MDSIILLLTGILISIILIIIGVIMVYYNYNTYIKTSGIIEEAECGLDRDVKNFVYKCKVKLSHIIENKKYINIKNIKTELIPYREYDTIELYYNKNNPSEIITTEGIENIYTYIPFILGIILFIISTISYLIFM
tara:strand:- start:1779 stop:2183 length:405 start_codon:yes stop_codon:yes gene_type:complete